MRTGNPTVIVNWVSSNWIQLVLLPALMVGQKLQGDAADARAIKTFEDTERLLDLMDVRTEGSLKEILDAVKAARS